MKLFLLSIVFGLFLISPTVNFGQAFQIVPGTISDRVDENGNPTNTYYGAPYGGLTTIFDSSPYKDFHLEYLNNNNVWKFAMNYRLLSPNGYDPNDVKNKYPMIVMMHGAGESGRSWPGRSDPYPVGSEEYLNNDVNLKHGGKQHLDAVMRDPSHTRAFPGFVLFAQNVSGKWNEDEKNYLIKIIELLVKDYNIDPNRIYVHGLSAGGVGVWSIVEQRPDLFAAWLVMSAAMTSPYNYERISHIPSWVFQGGTDENPFPHQTENSLNRLENAGGNPRYTLYPKLEHGTWNTAYAEPDFFSWMLGHSKLNIHADGGRTEFCESEGVNTTIGFSPGFEAYQWKKNETIIPNATGNELAINDFATYSVGFKRAGDIDFNWSNPLVIARKNPPPAPIITADGSTALTSLDNKTNVTLSAPEGFDTYTWFKDGTNHSDQINITVYQPGAYTLVVKSINDCESNISDPIYVTTGSNISIETPPENLTATAASETQIDLFWEDSSPDKTGFELYRTTTPGSNYTFVKCLSARAVNFSDTTLAPGTTYYYVLRSVNNEGASEPSDEVAATTFDDEQAPSPPHNLAVAKEEVNSITLTWEPAGDNVAIDEYLVYQAGNSTPIGNTSDLSFKADNLTEGQTYQFYVKAIDKAGLTSPASNQVTGTTAFCGLYYEVYGGGTYNSVDELGTKPEQLMGTGKINNFDLNVVTRHWSLNDYFGVVFNGYILIEETGDYTFYTSSEDGSKLFIDGVLIVDNDGRHEEAIRVEGIKYLEPGAHKIQVKFFQAPSDYLLEVGYTTPGGIDQLVTDEVLCSSSFSLPEPPQAPNNLTATTISGSQINLTWSDNSDNESGFEIYRAKENKEFKLIHTSGVNETAYSDVELNASTTYFYKVRAIGNTGQSSYTYKSGGELDYAYYEGDWNELPDFTTLTPVKTGTVANFSLTPRERSDYFAFTFEGLIKIPQAGSYTFYTASDDGSRLYINGVQVVYNDFLQGTTERSGKITLSEDIHHIKVTYFEKNGGESLEVSYEGPGLPQQPIPGSAIVTHESATTAEDDIPPAPPTNLFARTTTHESVGLSWSPPVDNDLVGYTIYGNGVKVGSTMEEESEEEINMSADSDNEFKIMATGEEKTVSYLVTGLDKSTQYKFIVKSRDKAGNLSEPSNAITVTTKSFDPLPVEFISFTGRFENHQVILNWATASETNNDYFTVERSSSLDDFEAMGTLDGAGNSDLKQDYEYIDYAPIAGTAYYRIKQTDMNGEYDYSKIINVTSDRLSMNSLEIYPNPTDAQNINVQLKSFDLNSPVAVKIVGILGKSYYSGTYSVVEINKGVTLSAINPLMPGIYVVIVEQANLIIQKKLIIE